MRTEIFVCDRCGQRKRLDRTKQHWCDVCAGKQETELRPVGSKPTFVYPTPTIRK